MQLVVFRSVPTPHNPKAVFHLKPGHIVGGSECSRVPRRPEAQCPDASIIIFLQFLLRTGLTYISTISCHALVRLASSYLCRSSSQCTSWPTTLVFNCVLHRYVYVGRLRSAPVGLRERPHKTLFLIVFSR